MARTIVSLGLFSAVALLIKDDGGWVLITAGGDRIGWVYGKMLRPVG